ncbi:hypothetical protein SAMN06297387_11072 [Streptomyces zhaozhouensis]|uniref:PH domain-containing protein n=1 Tax=Streptomyces zhaozhouensis TaxID=1300267 RepID=A0A286DXI3_9ACTN|nr:hypothetical protein [Streptomyces zhaozhouensis]SOD63340.1 hypothetical protein SAMN06297387_11072 [Streptomyces zhaozhouensis]
MADGRVYGPNGEREFGEVQIGKGVRPMAQHGQLLVDTDTLTLRNSKGTLIDEAPVSEVSAHRVRFTGGRTVALRMSGDRYHVSPGWGDRGDLLTRRPERVAKAADDLLNLIETGGGTVR